MKILRLENFTRGWVVGDFEPSVIRTKAFEFAVQNFKAGDKDRRHLHKIAKEVTVIAAGEFMLNGRSLKPGDVILVEPGDPVELQCVSDGATAVIKTPSVIGDKYLAD